MKKLIKPRGGGGGKEGRALFIAAGSVENLADSNEFTSDTHPPKPGETHTHWEISTQTLIIIFFQADKCTNVSWLVFAKMSSHAQPMERGCRRAYKSSHDYQVHRYHSHLFKSLPAESLDSLKLASSANHMLKGAHLWGFIPFSMHLETQTRTKISPRSLSEQQTCICDRGFVCFQQKKKIILFFTLINSDSLNSLLLSLVARSAGFYWVHSTQVKETEKSFIGKMTLSC